MLQSHPVIAGVPNVAGIGCLLAPTLSQIGTAAIAGDEECTKQEERDFAHDAFAS